MNLEELQQEAKNGNMVAQYDLAMYYGKLLKETEDEDEIYKYSLDAMLWLKKSAQQGYGPAMEAVNELDVIPREAEKAPSAVDWPEEFSEIEEPPAPPEKELPEPPAEEPADTEEETAAAVAAAVMESTAELMDPQGDRNGAASSAEAPYARSEDAFAPGAYDEEPSGSRRFSTANTVLCCMLAVSLLLNVLLLIFLFRMSKDKNPVPPSPGPVASSSTPAPAPSSTPSSTPNSAPTASPSPTPEVTPEPSPTPEVTPEPSPTPEPFWLDLSQYPKLELKPNEDQLYEDYVYYIVTAADTLNMRSGPDTRYDRITTIPGMTKVGAVSKYGSWYLVEYGSEMGWVSGDYLTSNLNYQRPAATAAPAPPSSSGNLTTYD